MQGKKGCISSSDPAWHRHKPQRGLPVDRFWKEDVVDHAKHQAPGGLPRCPGVSDVTCCSTVAFESALVLRDDKLLPVWNDASLEAHELYDAAQLLMALLQAKSALWCSTCGTRVVKGLCVVQPLA